MTSVVRLAGFILFALLALGCGPERFVSATPPPAEEPINYPAGPWWRGDFNQTLFGIDHILVSYGAAERTDQLLAVPGPPPQRTRDEALVLAKQIRAELKLKPERFAALARERSDDPTTAALGGAIGEIFAPHLPNPIVDALGNLEPGEISRVVETKLGFHVVRRVAVRPETTLDASQISIAYVGTETMLRPDRTVTRTREEARELASRIYGELAASPARFAELAREQSDSFDAELGGDFGQWSTHARSGEPTPLHVLSALEPGGVSRPIEMTSGFRIFKREPLRERQNFAVAALIIATKTFEYPDGLPRSEALAIAKDVATRARRDPDTFAALRQEHCDFGMCAQEAVPFKDGFWMFSSAVPALRAAKVGELIADPIELPIGFAVMRREDESKYTMPEPVAVVMEMPTPEMPSLSTATPGQLAWYIGELRDRARTELKLDAQKWEQVSALFDQLLSVYETAPAEQRGALTAEVNAELAKALGPLKALELAQLHERMQRSLAGEKVEEL